MAPPLPEISRQAILHDMRNDSLNKPCGRCLRPGHLMRECKAALDDCWNYHVNAAEAEAVYQGFLQAHAPTVHRTLRVDAPTFVPSSARDPTVHQTPRAHATPFVPPWTGAPTVHQTPRAHATPFVPPWTGAPTVHQTPRAHVTTSAWSSTGSWRKNMAETNANFQNSSIGASSNARTPASDLTTNQQEYPTELRDGQQQAVQYKYHGQKESDPKASPPDTKELIYTHTTTPLPEKRDAENAVMTNFVQVKSIPDKLFEYAISNSYMQPQGNGTHQVRSLNRGADLRQIFEEVQQPYLNGLLGNRAWATDFVKLWTDSELANHSAIPSHQLTFIDSSGESVDLTIQVAFTQSLDNIRQTLQTQQIEDASEAITALNAIVTRPLLNPRTGYSLTQTGANRLYINEGRQDLHPLRAHRGYYSSIRPGKGGIFLNVNTITSAFFRPCRVSDLILEVRNLRDRVDLSELEKWLRGITLRVVHERSQPSTPSKRSGNINDEKRRLKTFKNFGDVASQQRFWTREASATDAGITVYDYFTNTLNIKGLVKDLPCVNVGKPLNLSLSEYEKSRRGAVWIPAELLEIKPYQRMKAQLCPSHTARMINIALREPAAHSQLIIEEGLDVLGIRNASGQPAPTPAVQGTASNTVQNMSDFDLDDRLVDVPANFLRAPRLQCNRLDRGRYSHGWTTPQTASWNLRDTAFYQAGNIDFLNVYFLNTSEDYDKQGCLILDMTNRLVHHGLGTHQGDELSGNKFQLDDFWTNASQAKRATLVVFRDSNLFDDVKWKADLVYGVHNVCALFNKINYEKNQTEQQCYQIQHLDNLALKFNMKTGGYNFLFDDNILKQDTMLGVHRETTIIFGADVNHPPLGSYTGIPSVAAVVASLDKSFQNYPGSMRLQAGNQEMIDDMEDMVYERLEAWCTHTGNQIDDPDYPGSKKARVPTLLLFYRDGLSESQFAECREREIKAVRTAFTRIASKYSPDTPAALELTFIVAGKRHNTRFYPKEPADTCFKYNPRRPGNANGQGNVKPGLLVSEVITTPGTLNFYLQSHAAIRGTARSAHYHVLHDDHNWDVMDLADLTHMLCYCFPRATKGVSYAAPAYIADRLCDRGRVWLKCWKPEKEQFVLPPKDDGKSRTKEQVSEWKKGKAREIERMKEVWGPNFNDNPGKGVVRFNPWKPNLDESMFWM